MDQPLHPLPVREIRISDILATLPGTIRRLHTLQRQIWLAPAALDTLQGVSNGRHSPPSPPHLVNGMPSSKSNGSWINPSMGMGSSRLEAAMGKEVISTRGWRMTMMNGIGWWQGTEIENE